MLTGRKNIQQNSVSKNDIIFPMQDTCSPLSLSTTPPRTLSTPPPVPIRDKLRRRMYGECVLASVRSLLVVGLLCVSIFLESSIFLRLLLLFFSYELVSLVFFDFWYKKTSLTSLYVHHTYALVGFATLYASNNQHLFYYGCKYFFIEASTIFTTLRLWSRYYNIYNIYAQFFVMIAFFLRMLFEIHLGMCVRHLLGYTHVKFVVLFSSLFTPWWLYKNVSRFLKMF